MSALDCSGSGDMLRGMYDAINDGLRFLAESFSVDRPQWRRHYQGGDMLLDGLVSHGYAIEKGGRFAVSRMGNARMADVDREVHG